MKTIKFLHCADLHLDMPFTSLGVSGNKSTVRREDIKKTFRRIIDTARNEEVDILLIAGDLYEHEYARKSTINFVNDCFYEISDIKVVISPGNHDPYVSNSFYKNYSWSPNVSILSSQQPNIRIGDVACVHGCGFTGFQEARSLIDGISDVDANMINILLIHGTVGLEFTKEAYNPMTVDELDSLGMDYIALGHFHNRFAEAGKFGNIYNPGSAEPLGFDETGRHGVFVGTISKPEGEMCVCDVHFVELNSRSYTVMEIDVSGCTTVDRVADRMARALRGQSIDRKHLLNVTLKGFVDNGVSIDVQQLQSYFEDKVFFMKIKDETSSDYNFEEIIKEPGLRGLFVRKAFSLIDQTADERRKKLLMKSVYYGLQALEQGRVDV
jgi:exonuclease SbcD